MSESTDAWLRQGKRDFVTQPWFQELVLFARDEELLPEGLLSDISQMTSNFVEIVPRPHLQGNCIPFAAIRWHDFGNRPALGRPFG